MNTRSWSRGEDSWLPPTSPGFDSHSVEGFGEEQCQSIH